MQENLYMRDAIKLTFRKLKVNGKSNFQSETTCSSSSFYLKNIRLKLNSSTVHHVIVSKLSKLIRVDEKDRLSPRQYALIFSSYIDNHLKHTHPLSTFRVPIN